MQRSTRKADIVAVIEEGKKLRLIHNCRESGIEMDDRGMAESTGEIYICPSSIGGCGGMFYGKDIFPLP